MMIANIGIGGMVIIIVLALILFGPSKLPELGRAIGQTLSEFKKGTRDLAQMTQEVKEIEHKD